MVKKWRVLAKKEMSLGKFCPIIKYSVEKPSGEKIEDYYTTDFGSGVMVVPVTEEGKIIMVRQYRLAVDEVTLEFPAGRIEEGETNEEAASRELFEETGFRAKEFKFLGKLVEVPSKNSGRVGVYLARCVAKNEGVDELKIGQTEVVVTDWDGVEKMILEGKITEALTMASWMLARKFV